MKQKSHNVLDKIVSHEFLSCFFDKLKMDKR